MVRIPSRASQEPHVLLSVDYHFVDALCIATPPLSPHSSCGSEVDVASFCVESSVRTFTIPKDTAADPGIDSRF